MRPVQGTAELQACVGLQELTWGPGFGEAVPMTMLALMQKLGGVVAGAFADNELIGFVFGMPALRHDELVHWSDMLAVRPDRRDRGIGVALKRYQREQVMHQGIRHICWTFEPLEARNAHLNFARLGVTAREYLRDFYSESDSPLHAGVGTDRLVAVWEVASERVARRLRGNDHAPAGAETLHYPLINHTDVPTPPRLNLDADVLRLAIPHNLQQLKREDFAAASAWRASVREALEHYLGRGYVVSEFVRERERGWYLLSGS